MPALELPFETEVKRPTLRVVQREDIPRILEAVRAEGAECLAPTHVFEQGTKVVGYGSAGRLAIVAGWMSEAVDDETSLAALRAMENAVNIAGFGIVCVPCTEDCRFKPFLEQQGYTEGGKQITLYFKKVR